MTADFRDWRARGSALFAAVLMWIKGTDEGTDAIGTKKIGTFQRIMRWIWRSVRHPYWHSHSDAAELAYREKRRNRVRELRAFAEDAQAKALMENDKDWDDDLMATGAPARAGVEAHRVMLAEIAEVLLRHAPGSAALKVSWNGKEWSTGSLKWFAELMGHRTPPADIPEALAAALADGLIPDSVPPVAGLEAHLKGWVRREMALLVAGVGIKHREKFNP